MENLNSLRMQFVLGLELADFVVDAAATLDEALALLDRRTYSMALVDLMLNDPHDTSLGGVYVLEHLRALNEGTCAIVISGQTSLETSRDMFKEYHVDDYFAKMRILEGGIAFLTREVAKALDGHSIKKHGEHDAVIPVLAGGEERSPVWTANLLRSLKPRGGFDGLQDFLTQFVDPLVPLIPPSNAAIPFALEEAEHVVKGRFWSKGQGFAIELVVCQEEDAERFEDRLTDLVHSHIKSPLAGLAFRLPDSVSRAEFI